MIVFLYKKSARKQRSVEFFQLSDNNHCEMSKLVECASTDAQSDDCSYPYPYSNPPESGFIKKIIVIFIENSVTFIHSKVLDSKKRCRSFLRSFKNLDYLATHFFTKHIPPLNFTLSWKVRTWHWLRWVYRGPWWWKSILSRTFFRYCYHWD